MGLLLTLHTINSNIFGKSKSIFKIFPKTAKGTLVFSIFFRLITTFFGTFSKTQKVQHQKVTVPPIFLKTGKRSVFNCEILTFRTSSCNLERLCTRWFKVVPKNDGSLDDLTTLNQITVEKGTQWSGWLHCGCLKMRSESSESLFYYLWPGRR